MVLYMMVAGTSATRPPIPAHLLLPPAPSSSLLCAPPSSWTGLQGDGELELRIDWKVENEQTGAMEARVALLSVNPWLAYGCTEGARLSMRKPGALEGKCATVQRTLRDDSVVVRVDGMVGEVYC